MSLPLALVIRLLSLFLESENITVYESSLPETLAKLYLPTKTQVAVSFVRQEHKTDFFAGIALDTSLTPGAFTAEMSTGLEQSGWRQQPEVLFTLPLLFKPFGSSLPETDTFEDNPFTTRVFTKGNRLLRLPYPSADPKRATHAYIQIERADNLPPQEAISGRLFELLPQLIVPADTEPGVGITSGDDSYVSGSVSLTTELVLSELITHFTSQFEAAGWQVTEQLSGKEIALAALEYHDKKNVYNAQLSVFRSADLYSTVRLEASRHSVR